MVCRRIFFGLAIAAFCFVSRPLCAVDDWQPINPDELRMTSAEAGNADAIVLYHQEVSDDTRRTSSKYTRLKVLTEKGKDYANVELVYSGTDFHIIDIKARTVAPDGSITPFTGKAFDKTVIKGHGIKILAKTFSLPNVQVGSIIEYKYSEYWDNESLYAPHWTVQGELLQKRAKFTFIPYSGSATIEDNRGNTKDRVYYSLIQMPKNTTIKTTPDRKMELELKDIPAYQEEDFGPPEEVTKMRVDFYYGDDKMGKPEQFWKEEGKYWSKDVEKFIGHSSAVAAAAAQATGPADTPEQKARKIYALVQKMKNRSYDPDTSLAEDLAQEKHPDKTTAESVLGQQRGFSDDLTRLFVAMVRTVNIPAYVMRIATRDRVFFEPNIPNRFQLNAEVAIVQLGDKEVFLDPGTRFCPYGLLQWTRTSVKGIRETAGGGTALSQTPPAAYPDALTRRTAKFSLADDGALNGRMTIVWTGQEALKHRSSAFKTDEAGRKKELEDEIKAILPSAAVVKFEFAKDWEDPEKPLTVTLGVEIPGFAASTGKRLLFPSSIFQVNTKQRFSDVERKTMVYFAYPYRTFDVVQISLPPSWQVENLPQTPPLQTDFAIYKVGRSAKDSLLTFNRDFAIAGFVFPPEYYGSLRSFYSGVNTGDAEQIVIGHAAAK
jgi:hypothetical protein